MPIPDEVNDLYFQAASLSHNTEHSHASIRHAQRRLRATGLSVEKTLEAMPILLEEARANEMSLPPDWLTFTLGSLIRREKNL